MGSRLRTLGISLALGAGLLAAHAPAEHEIPRHDAAAQEQGDQREREGTRLSRQLGRFKTTGDRLTFVVAGSERQYLGLENLALERIGKVLADRSDMADTLQWEVTGTLTEYRGANYLLVTHAVLKSKAAGGAATFAKPN